MKNCDAASVVLNTCTTQSVTFPILEKCDLAYDKEEFVDSAHDKVEHFERCQLSFCTCQEDPILAEMAHLLLQGQFIQK